MLVDPVKRRNVGWYAVRCCCQPLKILGFIQVETDKRRFKILDRRGQHHEVELRRIVEATYEMSTTIMSEEEAIYSGDRPIEFWRTIPGFVEVSD
jgi:hypothetical protein